MTSEDATGSVGHTDSQQASNGPFEDQALSAAITNADSPAWSVRAAAGRQLAAATPTDDVVDRLLRLLLDPYDTAVTQDTAEALLARGDTVGLRCVLLARSRATTSCTMDELGAALNGTPDWMTNEGTSRLIKQLRELAADDDAGVRAEADSILEALSRNGS
jgi:hypothetical protein